MAYVNGKSGSFEFQDANKQFTWRVNWTETYDAELNTSIVSVSIDIKSRVYNDYWYPNCLIKVNGEQLCEMNFYNPPTHYVYCKADDTTWKPIVKNGGYGKVELPVDSSPIEHDADGSKSIIIEIEANPVKNDTTIQLYNGTYGRKTFGTSQTQTVALTNIPRRANLTVENGTLGVAQTLGVTRYYNGFTHSITCTIGSETKTICEKDTATAYTWTPPMELAKQIPNAEKGVAIYKISTYNGETLIGSQEVPAELTVPDNIRPTVSATWSDPTGAKDKMGSFVKMVSTMSVDIVGVGAYGSTITGASMTLNGKAYAGGVIMDAGNLELVVAVNDSRGRKGSTAYTIDVADYAVPSIRVDASRCQEDGTADEMGEFARVTVTGNVVQVNEANTATLQLTYGSTTEGYEFDPGAIKHVQIIPAPSVSTLTIAATLTDRLQSATQSMVLSIGYATLDFLAGGKGIAFGTTAKQEGFYCAMPAYFTGGVYGADRWTESQDYPGCMYRSVDGQQEWLNPPMEPDTEYRTARRCGGLPVYTKYVNLGQLPASGRSQTYYNLASQVKQLVRAELIAVSSEASYCNLTTMTWYVGSYGDPYIVVTSTGEDHTNKTGYILLEYTKK